MITYMTDSSIFLKSSGTSIVEPHQKWPQWKADCKEFICKEGKLREKADV